MHIYSLLILCAPKSSSLYFINKFPFSLLYIKRLYVNKISITFSLEMPNPSVDMKLLISTCFVLFLDTIYGNTWENNSSFSYSEKYKLSSLLISEIFILISFLMYKSLRIGGYFFACHFLSNLHLSFYKIK